MIVTVEGVLKELGPSSRDGDLVDYRYIEFRDGQVLQSKAIGQNLNEKLKQALNTGVEVKLASYDRLIIGVLYPDGTGYISKLDNKRSIGTRQFFGWAGIVVGIATIPLLFIGLVIIYHSIRILYDVHLLKIEEKITKAQEQLINQFPKAQVLVDF